MTYPNLFCIYIYIHMYIFKGHLLAILQKKNHTSNISLKKKGVQPDQRDKKLVTSTMETSASHPHQLSGEIQNADI